MFDHMNGVMWPLAQKMIQWMEDLYNTVKLALQHLSQHYTEVTPT